MKTKLPACSLMLLFILSLAWPLTPALLTEESSEVLLTGARSTACSGSVCINEVIPDPQGADTGLYPNGEWFELYNSGGMDVDLTGWKVTTSASKTLAFDANTIVGYQSGNASSWTISPGEYVVIARNGDSNFYLTNTGLSMTLVDNNNNNLHTATWGTATSGTSYEQDPSSATANWIATGSPTPGQINSAGGPTTLIPGDLIITEVMANPWPSFDNATWPGGEWIEVMNTGTSDLDLTGYSLVDAAGNALEFNTTHLVNATSSSSSFLISPGQHRIVAVNGTSPYGVLNNGAETLTLKWPNGSPSQEISWSTTLQGFSLTASTQANGLWSYAAYPSPESLNPMAVELMPRQTFEVQFSELLPNATNDGANFPDGEWIELHNTGTVSIDLMGWTILDGMGNVTHLDPGSLVFNSSQGATIIDGGERRLVQFTSHTQLWDDHNHLFLRDASNVIVDTAFYTTDYGEDIALIRNTQSIDPWTPAPWKTPGQPEPGTTPSASTVRFSEILPDAIGADNQRWPDGEWIELHNYGSTDVDLTGWKLQAASRSLTLHESNMPLQSTPVLPAGEVVLIALNGTSSFYLKHTSADSIGLLDATGSTVDTITWSDTVEGESLIPPNSTHAGVGPNGSLTTGDWVLSAWATPGQLNPVWPAYTGSLSLAVTEVLPYCNDDSIIPNEDWVEVHNTGSTPLNISRWSVLNADGERRFMRLNDIWADTNQTAKVELLPDERAVFLMDAWMLTGLGDSFELLHPDGDIVTNVAWTAITDCQTLMPGITAGDDWQHTLWPTPGAPEPDASQFAGKDDLIFTRFMPSATTDASGDMEFIEITNLGQQLAVLNGWTLRSTTGSMSTYNASITSLMIQPQQSVLLANDADQLSSYEIGTVVDISDALDRTFYFPNSGAALQLLDPSGAQADTLVYGNGPVTLSGWSGIALVEPIAYLDNIIYLRGSGCGDAPDTNTVADWHLRWSRLGGSTFCYDRHIVSNGDITPLISPENGVVDLLSWIEDATTNLTVHLYQLQHAQLVHALIDAQQRGVEVSVFLDYGDDWWSQYELDTQRGMATTLLSNGVEVHWFGDEGENPYAYLHSKVSVRDGRSVWMGSGNWKSSSQPSPETPGNRDWGVIVDDASLAEMVLQHLAFDMDNGQSHISPVLLSDAPSGWSMPSKTPIVGQTATSIAGAFEAELLVCPDTCIDSLVTILNGAEEEILLSLQYLDMDWSYGWGDNPIVTALGDAAQRGVRIRLVLNGAYLDEDIQLVVDRFNEEWNFTNGYDTAAIVMSDNETVTKLHNKGAIIDGEHVLISSINWGDSALVRNREMGLLLSSPAVASVYEDAWWDDWNRVDSTTDSDQDRLLDAWEVMYGLNRTRRSVVGNALSDESMVDMDGDGLSNFAEQLHGGNPTKADTDGDCILDGVEVAWAQATALNDSMVRVVPLDALTKADADGNGVLDAEELGCDLGGISLPNDNTTSQGNDEDADGVLNDSDRCPNTLPGAPTDEQGCSSAQRAALVQDSTENTSGNAAQSFFLIVMVFALLLSAGAYFVLQNMRSESQTVNEALGEVAFEEVMPTPVQPGWQKPVLDATQLSITADMLARVPGWDETMVETYLKQGWTMDQLATYYQEQMEQHVQSEQH